MMDGLVTLSIGSPLQVAHSGSGAQGAHHAASRAPSLYPTVPLPPPPLAAAPVSTREVDPFHLRMQELATTTAEADWDGEGAGPIEPARWHRASAFATLVHLVTSLPYPIPSPSPDGAVYLTWLAPDGRRLVVAERGEAFEWMARRQDGSFDEGDVAGLIDVLKRIRAELG